MVNKESEESWKGIKGARKYASSLQALGEYMAYVPGPKGKVGDAVASFGSGYDSYLDYYTNDPNFKINLTIRVVSNATDFTINKVTIDQVENGANPYEDWVRSVYEGVVGSSVQGMENATREEIK